MLSTQFLYQIFQLGFPKTVIPYVKSNCYKNTAIHNLQEQYGFYKSIGYNLPPKYLDKVRTEGKSLGVGSVGITGHIEVKGENPVYVGYFDQKALSLKKLTIKSGRLPQKAGEAAIEEDVYTQLNLTAKVGETVSLSYKTSSGVKTQTFRLVGIVSRFIQNWFPPNTGWGWDFKLIMPGILTVPDNSGLEYSTVMFEKDLNNADQQFVSFLLSNLSGQNNSIGNLTSNNFTKEYMLQANSEVQNTSERTSLMSIMLSVLIALGIYNIMVITFKDREKYIQLLRKIGLKRSGVYKMILSQAAILAVVSAAAGLILGFSVFEALVALSSLFGIKYYPAVSMPSFIFPVVLCIACVLAAFGLQAIFLSSSMTDGEKPVSKKPAGARTKGSSFTRLWVMRSFRSQLAQNILSLILVAATAMSMTYGIFCAEYDPRGMYYNKLKLLQNVDYQFIYNSSKIAAPTLFSNFPVGSGVAPSDIKLLENTPGVKVVDSLMDTSAVSLYLKTTATESGSELAKKFKGKSVEDFAMTESEKQQIKDGMAKLGYTKGDTLSQVNFICMSANQLKDLSKYLVSGSIDYEKFKMGQEVISAETSAYRYAGADVSELTPPFHLRDSFTLTHLVFPTNSTELKLDPNSKKVDFKTEVSAVLKLKPQELAGTNLQLLGGKIIVSSEYLLSIDPKSAYDIVEVKIEDTSKANKIDALIREIYNRSKGVSLNDAATLRNTLNRMVQNNQQGTYTSMWLFMLLILCCLIISVNVKIRLKKRQLSILRSVGLSGAHLFRLGMWDTALVSFIGLLLGFIAGFYQVYGPFFTHFSFVPGVPYDDIIYRTVIPADIILFLAVMLVNVPVVLISSRWLLKRDISEDLTEGD
jgi:ABC-type antimicrobial peptide transport system permease subunit